MTYSTGPLKFCNVSWHFVQISKRAWTIVRNRQKSYQLSDNRVKSINWPWLGSSERTIMQYGDISTWGSSFFYSIKWVIPEENDAAPPVALVPLNWWLNACVAMRSASENSMSNPGMHCMRRPTTAIHSAISDGRAVAVEFMEEEPESSSSTAPAHDFRGRRWRMASSSLLLITYHGLTIGCRNNCSICP